LRWPFSYSLTLGTQSSVILLIRQQLIFWGDLSPHAPFNDVLDDTLHKAIQRFQKRHFLTPDGIVGKQTASYLNSAFDRVTNSIVYSLKNMERYVTASTPQAFILINLATYTLYGMEQGRVTHRQPVIIGKALTPTPLQNCNLTALTVNPFWHVPPTLFVREKLQYVRQNPAYLSRAGFIVHNEVGEVIAPENIPWEQLSKHFFPYSIKQRPGPRNAMGKIKFHLDSKEDIYLHDTPGTHLFKPVSRAFSSGCVRLGKPLDLAKWAFKNYNLAPLYGQKRDDATHLTRAQSLPVHFVYIPAWIQNGTVYVSDDPYRKVG
jgi:murein L,D-transpeptidase YcbB/YkuD